MIYRLLIYLKSLKNNLIPEKTNIIDVNVNVVIYLNPLNTMLMLEKLNHVTKKDAIVK